MSKHYLNLRKIAQGAAIVIASTMILSGCSTDQQPQGNNHQVEEKDKKEEKVVHVKDSSGNWIPLLLFMQRGGTIGPNTNFSYPASTGGYVPYTPSSNEMSSIKNGTFSGKVSVPTGTKASGTSGATKTNTSTSKSSGSTVKSNSSSAKSSSSSSIKSFGGSSSRSGSIGG